MSSSTKHSSTQRLQPRNHLNNHMSAIVWFSGISALNLIDAVPYCRFEEYAANHFDEYRAVDNIVAYDRQIIAQIDCKPHIQYHTQPKWAQSPWRSMEWNKDQVAISDSGTLAVEVALSKHQEVYIIGCDWNSTDISLQDHHYKFRGWSPPKFVKQHTWLEQRGHRVTWVHLKRQAWMTNFLSHSDFLDLVTSTRH